MYSVIIWSGIGVLMLGVIWRKQHRHSQKTASDQIKLELEQVKTEKFLLELQEVIEIRNLNNELLQEPRKSGLQA